MGELKNASIKDRCVFHCRYIASFDKNRSCVFRFLLNCCEFVVISKFQLTSRQYLKIAEFKEI